MPRPLAPRFDQLQAIARRFPQIDAQSLATSVALLRLSTSLSSALDQQYARHGIARGRFHVLMLLYKAEGEGLTPHELADLAAVTRAAMTGLIDTLREAQLVSCVDDPLDRRTYRVFLTDEGHRFLKKMLPDHFRRMSALVGGLSLQEKRSLVKMLEKVNDALGAFDEELPRAQAR
jgi:DNA-binding MarR family transcriptional regulator